MLAANGFGAGDGGGLEGFTLLLDKCNSKTLNNYHAGKTPTVACTVLDDVASFYAFPA